jgi:pyruvate dehydrogenase E1 component
MTTPVPGDLSVLAQLERKVLWLAAWTIHHANHVRENTDGGRTASQEDRAGDSKRR